MVFHFTGQWLTKLMNASIISCCRNPGIVLRSFLVWFLMVCLHSALFCIHFGPLFYMLTLHRNRNTWVLDKPVRSQKYLSFKAS